MASMLKVCTIVLICFFLFVSTLGASARLDLTSSTGVSNNSTGNSTSSSSSTTGASTATIGSTATTGNPNPDTTTGNPNPDTTTGNPNPDTTTGTPKPETSGTTGTPKPEGTTGTPKPETSGTTGTPKPETSGTTGTPKPEGTTGTPKPATPAPTRVPTATPDPTLPTAAPTAAPPTLTVTVTVQISMVGDPKAINTSALLDGFIAAAGLDKVPNFDRSKCEIRIILVNDTRRAQKFKVEIVAKQTVLLSESQNNPSALAAFNATELTKKVETAVSDPASPLRQSVGNSVTVDPVVQAQATQEVYTPTLPPTTPPTPKPTSPATQAPTQAAAGTTGLRSAAGAIQVPVAILAVVASFVLLM